jgi:DNA invertase Pin-like site-specific DNA recombinase
MSTAWPENVAHLGVIKRDLEKQGLTVIFRKLPQETGPISNLLLNILGSFAEFERELITDRTRRGRRHRNQQAVTTSQTCLLRGSQQAKSLIFMRVARAEMGIELCGRNLGREN